MNYCPDCGEPMIFQEGLQVCIACGYNESAVG